MSTIARDICQNNVIAIQKHESLSQAARKMRDSHVGSLVVIELENGKRIPCGMITDRDILTRVLAKGASSTETFSVEDVMTRDIRTENEDTSLSDLIRDMSDHGIRRIPIVDKEKENETAQAGATRKTFEEKKEEYSSGFDIKQRDTERNPSSRY